MPAAQRNWECPTVEQVVQHAGQLALRIFKRVALASHIPRIDNHTASTRRQVGEHLADGVRASLRTGTPVVARDTRIARKPRQRNGIGQRRSVICGIDAMDRLVPAQAQRALFRINAALPDVRFSLGQHDQTSARSASWVRHESPRSPSSTRRRAASISGANRRSSP